MICTKYNGFEIWTIKGGYFSLKFIKTFICPFKECNTSSWKTGLENTAEAARNSEQQFAIPNSYTSETDNIAAGAQYHLANRECQVAGQNLLSMSFKFNICSNLANTITFMILKQKCYFDHLIYQRNPYHVRIVLKLLLFANNIF